MTAIRTKHRINPKSLANLKQEKGFTGNPGGRPKTSALREFLLEWLAAKGKGDKKNQLLIVERMAKIKPDVIWHYAYGKPVETVEISGPDGGAIEVESANVNELRAELKRMGALDAAGHLVTQRN